MTEIDVTDDIVFDSDGDDIFINCACGNKFPFLMNMYDLNTRFFWCCPTCQIKLAFRGSRNENKIIVVQVIDD